VKPERGPRTEPIAKAKRPYWLCDAYLKKAIRMKGINSFGSGFTAS
jgi:hypothetical protein